MERFNFRRTPANKWRISGLHLVVLFLRDVVESLRLYTVDKDYIEYLGKHEKQILFSEGKDYRKDRKYVGVVLEIHGFNYFAPLSSPKESDYIYVNGKKVIRKSIIPIIRLVSKNNTLLGKIKLNNMIPVPKSCLNDYDVDNESDCKYKSLVIEEIICIRKNRELIVKNAKILYRQKTREYTGIKYLDSTVDFKKIETLYKDYIQR